MMSTDTHSRFRHDNDTLQALTPFGLREALKRDPGAADPDLPRHLFALIGVEEVEKMEGKLTDAVLAEINKPGRYGDGAGLYLQVSKNLTKSWVFRYVRNGSEHALGLGSVRYISLDAAREQASMARKLLKDGIDPRLTIAQQCSTLVSKKQAAMYIDENCTLTGKLTDASIREIQKPGRYSDGLGLYLQVSKYLTKSWVFRYERNGSEHAIGLGSLGAKNCTSLIMARKKANRARSLLARGVDLYLMKKGEAKLLKAQQQQETPPPSARKRGLENLSKKQLEDLCKRVKSGEAKTRLARSFGVSFATLNKYLAEHQIESEQKTTVGALLSPEQVDEIKERASRGEHKPDLAREFCIGISCLYEILDMEQPRPNFHDRNFVTPLTHEQAYDLCLRAGNGEKRARLAMEFGISLLSVINYINANLPFPEPFINRVKTQRNLEKIIAAWFSVDPLDEYCAGFHKTPKIEPGRYPDSKVAWLYLDVTEEAMNWLFCSQHNGQKYSMVIGSPKDFTIVDARKEARLAQRRVAKGVDPLQIKRSVGKILYGTGEKYHSPQERMIIRDVVQRNQFSLTPKQVIKLYKQLSLGKTKSSLARELGISYSAVNACVEGSQITENSAPGRYQDSRVEWLYLEVNNNGSKNWIFCSQFNGQAYSINIGSIQDFTIIAARKEARKNQRRLIKGIDIAQLNEAVEKYRIEAEFNRKDILAPAVKNPRPKVKTSPELPKHSYVRASRAMFTDYFDIKKALALTTGWDDLNAYDRTQRFCAELLRIGKKWPSKKTVFDIIGTDDIKNIRQGLKDFLAALQPCPPSTQTTHLVVPVGIDFSDLKLKNNGEGHVSFRWQPLERLCRENAIDLAFIRNPDVIVLDRYTLKGEINAAFPKTSDDNIAVLLLAWYQAHLQQGGAIYPVVEELFGAPPLFYERDNPFLQSVTAPQVEPARYIRQKQPESHPWRKWR